MDERKILYKQFLTDKNSYNLNTYYWRRKLIKFLDTKFFSESQLIKNIDSKGVNFYDGNPIFSFYNLNEKKGVRIIQEDPLFLEKFTGIKLIEAWISDILIPISAQDDERIQELVISLFLSHSSINKCLALVNGWFNNEISKENLATKLLIV